METSRNARQLAHTELIASRYRIQHVLGKGGMSVVYKAHDTSMGRRVALKRLKASEKRDNQQELVELFEREFHTLAQLSHPRVVEVYDYDKDELGPYYTMEFLDGGDLRELSPLPWATACARLCDICSALSLLHSRRLVHRDLTPRNIRCTLDDKAKVIDFGAMMPMGPSKLVVGTPGFVAPEALNGQLVEARTDLFSLGATAYYALTGRYAYPQQSHNLDRNRDIWRSQPVPPSAHVPAIPEELDQLVMSLLNLNLMARPASAAEVMERLSAIANLEIDEQIVVRQSYLMTPTLVGRDDGLLRMRKQMIRAVRKRGGAIMVSGTSGVGRSRFLDACVLEAKLIGATVLRADASDANRGSWGAVQAMAQQLLEALPRRALQAAQPYLAVLRHVLPELLHPLETDMLQRRERDHAQSCGNGPENASTGKPRGMPSAGDADTGRKTALKVFDNPQELRPQLQAALCDWLVDISEKRCLLIAVDDVHLIDEPSAAFVALLSKRARRQRLVVTVTSQTGAPTTSKRALELLSKSSLMVKLQDLELKDTEKLLSSVFGQVSNVRLVADRLHAVSAGNPRTIMQLAQHLLNTGLFRYEAGTWTLPSRINPEDLPQSLDEALKAQVQRLDTDALQLAQAMALCSKLSFSFDECLELSDQDDKARLIRDLDQLTALEILSTDGKHYSLRQETWRSVLMDGVDSERVKALHLRIADVLYKRATQPFLVAEHLLQAGQPERALDAFAQQARANSQYHREDRSAFIEYIQSLPDHWVSTNESLLAVCEELGRPRDNLYWLQGHLTGCASVTAQPLKDSFTRVIQQFYRESGLDLYEQLDENLDGTVRLQTALQLAQQRYEATSKAERMMAPADAIQFLAESILQALGGMGNTNDYEFFATIPSLGPLAALSPALEVLEQNLQSARHNEAGRLDQAREGCLKVIDRMAEPDHAGLQDLMHTYMRLALIFKVARIEVVMGIASVTEWSEQLDQDPLFQVNAWHLRMLSALRQGDPLRAEECRSRMELLQIQNCPTQFYEGLLLWPELLCYAALDDLLGVKRTIAEVERMADRYQGWIPCLHFGRGHYHRIRGDTDRALHEFERALAPIRAGRHKAWAAIAGARLYALLDAGETDRARELAQEALEAAEREHLGSMAIYLRQPLALAEAALKAFDKAVAHAETVIDTLERMGSTGVLLGSAYETRARIAIAMQDQEAFQRYALACSGQYNAGHSSGLTARYEQLIERARRHSLWGAPKVTTISSSVGDDVTAVSEVTSMLIRCQGARERAQCVLGLIVERSGAMGGLLYSIQQQGPTLSAQQGDAQLPSEIDSLVKAYLSAEMESSENETISLADSANSAHNNGVWTGPGGQLFFPVLLAHQCNAGFPITGVVVLYAGSGQRLDIPFQLIPVLSSALLRAGDAAEVLAAG